MNDNNVQDNFSKQLKLLRVENNCKQKEIADYLNLTLRAYQHYEEGNRFPPIETIIALSKKYKIPFMEVLFGKTTLKTLPINFDENKDFALLEVLDTKASSYGISSSEFISYILLKSLLIKQ